MTVIPLRPTDARPWAPHTSSPLTAPVTQVEVFAAELCAKGLVTVEQLIVVCAGSMVRAGNAIHWWETHDRDDEG